MYPRPDEDFFAHRRAGSPAVVDRDRRLALAVVRTLTDDVRTRREGVRVAAQNSVVMLTGTVGSWRVRETAGELARRTRGAVDLCNALQVDGDATDRRRADAFTELIASVPELRTPPAASRPGWWTAGPVIGLVLLLWLGLLLGIVKGWPALPLILAGVIVTAVPLSVLLGRMIGRR